MAQEDLQVSVESTEGLKRRIKMSLPARSFEQRVADRTRVVAREARVNGFRPGKMPVKEASRRFGASIRREVAADLMQESFFQAAERESFDVAGPPVFDAPDLSTTGEFTFVASFEVMPEIEVADLSGIRIVQPEAEVTTDDIDEMIQTLRERNRKWEPADPEKPRAIHVSRERTRDSSSAAATCWRGSTRLCAECRRARPGNSRQRSRKTPRTSRCGAANSPLRWPYRR